MTYSFMTGSPCMTWPIEGTSQSVKVFPTERAPPRRTAPMARMIIGIVMSGPDSCGCTGAPSASVVQRALPWKVMKNRRDM